MGKGRGDEPLRSPCGAAMARAKIFIIARARWLLTFSARPRVKFSRASQIPDFIPFKFELNEIKSGI